MRSLATFAAAGAATALAALALRRRREHIRHCRRYGLCPHGGGFMPSRCAERLPRAFAAWDALAAELPKLNREGELRAAVRRLPLLIPTASHRVQDASERRRAGQHCLSIGEGGVSSAQPPNVAGPDGAGKRCDLAPPARLLRLSEAELRRAYVILSAAAHSYVNGHLVPWSCVEASVEETAAGDPACARVCAGRVHHDDHHVRFIGSAACAAVPLPESPPDDFARDALPAQIAAPFRKVCELLGMPTGKSHKSRNSPLLPRCYTRHFRFVRCIAADGRV